MKYRYVDEAFKILLKYLGTKSELLECQESDY